MTKTQKEKAEKDVSKIEIKLQFPYVDPTQKETIAQQLISIYNTIRTIVMLP